MRFRGAAAMGTATFGLLAVTLALSQVLGGGTRQGFVGDVIVAALGGLLLFALVMQEPTASTRRWGGVATAVVILVLAVLASAPLVPLLAPGLSLFAERGALAGLGELPPDTLAEIGASRSRSVVSVYASSAALTSFIAPIAVYFAVRACSASQQVLLAGVMVGIGTVSLALGFLQVLQGPESGLRLFEVTNRAEAVGVFANRNHFAAELYTTLVLAAVGFATVSRTALDTRRGTPALLWVTLAAVVLLAIVAGLALARSRAGVLLAMAGMVGVFLLLTVQRPAAGAGRGNVGGRSNRLILLVFGGIVLFVMLFGLNRILTRFGSDPLEDLRWSFATTTANVAVQALPLGAGFGTFVPIYAARERPDDIFGAFANRAHNDLLEILLETGLAGAVLLVLLVGWLLVRTVVIWRRQPGAGGETHLLLQRAATIVVVLLLAHSLVDYPLRTSALAVMFAFACGVIGTRIDHAGERAPPTASGRTEHRTVASEPAPRPVKDPAPVATRPEPPRGPALEWPEAWRPPVSPPKGDVS